MADGKVTITTALDNSGLEKGLRHVEGRLGGLKSVVTKLGAAIAGAFAVGRVIQFGKERVDAARELSDALTGLQSIMDGQGRSFSRAQKFIEAYTADGLVPATNAINAYKNLALRGYDDSQIQQVMTALKDSAAFGRQASYSMGEAVQSATEGLKNENSILVDNAGVTKNVAKMWEEYAASIGTTANNLTQQQKIQAEVNGILEESRYQAGDAAKVAGTFSGQLMQLSFHFNNLKVAVGNAIIPVAQKVLPVINTIIAALTRLANAFATVMGAIFGKAAVQGSALARQNDAVAGSAAAGAAAEKKLAGSTKAAGKAAKNALGSFDELNVLQQETASAGGGASGGVGGASGASAPVSAELQVEDTLSPRLQAIVDKVQELLAPLRDINFEPLAAAFAQLKEAAAPLTQTLFAGLEWAYYNLFVPLAAWTAEDALPAFLDVLSGALRVLNSVLAALEPLGTWLWENFLQPIAEWTGGLIVSALEGLAAGLNGVSDWINENQGLVQGMTLTAGAFMAVWEAATIGSWLINAGGLVGMLGQITAAVKAGTIAKIADKAVDLQIIALYAGDFVRSVAGAVVSLATGTAAWLANTAAKVASTAAEWAQIAATTAWNAICAVATTVTTAFGAAVAFLTSPIGLVIVAVTALIAIIVLLVKNWDTVKEVAGKVWDGIVSVWNGACDWFKQKVLDPLTDGFKGTVNGIIGFINGLVRTVVDAVNFITSAINSLSFDVPDWVPLIGGKHFGFNIPAVTAPQIPMLAQGAVIPANREFLAVLGDQTSGTNIEAPASLIKQMVEEALAEAGASGEQEITINLTTLLDGEVLYKNQERVKARRGRRVVGNPALL